MATIKDKEDITVNGRKYFIGRMPALKAERLLIKSIGAITAGGFSALPDEALTELLAYAGGYNAQNNEVRFENEDIIEMFDVPLEDIIEIQARLVEKNFGFFANGGINRVLERLTNTFAKAKASQEAPATPAA